MAINTQQTPPCFAHEPKALATMLHELEHHGWSISDQLVPMSLSMGLLQEAQQRWQAQEFQMAEIGRSIGQQQNQSIRGDHICWINEPCSQVYTQAFLRWAQQLQTELNQYFYLGLKRLECHFARYDSGAGYAKHIDQHKNTGFRKISMVLYLNPDWQAGMGGELSLYAPEQDGQEIERVAPRLGRLALFRSDTQWHAVLPCHTVRWSLTGWFRNDDAFMPPALYGMTP